MVVPKGETNDFGFHSKDAGEDTSGRVDFGFGAEEMGGVAVTRKNLSKVELPQKA